MKQKIWAISDIHGCGAEFQAMLDNINIDYKNDLVIIGGDLIDRGSKSKDVVQKCLDLSNQYKNFIVLKGNHCDIFEDWKNFGGKFYGMFNWFNNGGKTTYESYGGHFGKIVNGEFEFPKEPDFPKEHLDFLFNSPISYETDDYFFVHGGVDDKPLKDNKDDYRMMWLRDDFINSSYDWGKKIIFGHSCDSRGRYGKPFYPIVMDNKIGIDCAVCPPSSKRLACLELPEEKFHFIESGSLKYSNAKLVKVVKTSV